MQQQKAIKQFKELYITEVVVLFKHCFFYVSDCEQVRGIVKKVNYVYQKVYENFINNQNAQSIAKADFKINIVL